MYFLRSIVVWLSVISIAWSSSAAATTQQIGADAAYVLVDWMGTDEVSDEASNLPLSETKTPLVVVADDLTLSHLHCEGRALYVLARNLRIDGPILLENCPRAVIVVDSLTFGPKGAVRFSPSSKKEPTAQGALALCYSRRVLEERGVKVEDLLAEAHDFFEPQPPPPPPFNLDVSKTDIFKGRRSGPSRKVARTPVQPFQLPVALRKYIEDPGVRDQSGASFGGIQMSVALGGRVFCRTTKAGFSLSDDIGDMHKHLPSGAVADWIRANLEECMVQLRLARLAGEHARINALLERARAQPFPTGQNGSNASGLEQQLAKFDSLVRSMLEELRPESVVHPSERDLTSVAILTWLECALTPTTAMLVPIPGDDERPWLGLLREEGIDEHVVIYLDFELSVDPRMLLHAQDRFQRPATMLGEGVFGSVQYECEPLFLPGLARSELRINGNRLHCRLVVPNGAVGSVLTALSMPQGLQATVRYQLDGPVERRGAFNVPLTLARQVGARALIRVSDYVHNDNDFPVRIRFLQADDAYVTLEQELAIESHSSVELPEFARELRSLGPGVLEITVPDEAVLCLGQALSRIKTPFEPVRVLTVWNSLGYDAQRGGAVVAVTFNIVHLSQEDGIVLSRSANQRLSARGTLGSSAMVPIFDTRQGSVFYVEGVAEFENGRVYFRTDPTDSDFLTVLPSDLTDS